MHPVIREIEAPLLRSDLPYFRPGDTVTVSVRIVEGDKERIQDYTGVVIARRGGGLRETITVRRVSYGVGMERVFQLHSPRIEGIKVVRRGKVRRAKLYYLRNLRGKKARLTERRVSEGKLAAEAAVGERALNEQIALAQTPAPAAEEAQGAEEPKTESSAAAETPEEAKAEAQEQQSEEKNPEGKSES